jgi:hypothetical protein
MHESELMVRRDKTLWRDVARDYHLLVDGKSVARIGHGKEARVALAPGKHTLQMKIDWCTSPLLHVECRAGATLVLDCGNNTHPLLALLYITLWKGKYLWLRPAQSVSLSKAAA